MYQCKTMEVGMPGRAPIRAQLLKAKRKLPGASNEGVLSLKVQPFHNAFSEDNLHPICTLNPRGHPKFTEAATLSSAGVGYLRLEITKNLAVHPGPLGRFLRVSFPDSLGVFLYT